MTNIFYKSPITLKNCVVTSLDKNCTLDDAFKHIAHNEGLNPKDFTISHETKIYHNGSRNNSAILKNNTCVSIVIPLLGGKGGFGSLLRAIGAQIERTTNRDACRDLSGRRLRDIKREDELRKLIALREQLQKERKRRKKERLEKLKKKTEASSTSLSIQELVSMFDDHAFNQRRLQLSDIIDAAVEKGIIKSKEIRSKTDSCGTDKREVNTEELTSSSPDQPESTVNKKDLWLGLDNDL